MPTARTSLNKTFSPTGKQPIDDAAYWLDRAEEIKTIAEGIGNPHARLLMLDLAETYKRLAEQAYERANRS